MTKNPRRAGPVQVWADRNWRTAVALAVLGAVLCAANAVRLALTSGDAILLLFAVFSGQFAFMAWRQYERGRGYY